MAIGIAAKIPNFRTLLPVFIVLAFSFHSTSDYG